VGVDDRRTLADLVVCQDDLADVEGLLLGCGVSVH
jgi:hypothetical protein